MSERTQAQTAQALAATPEGIAKLTLSHPGFWFAFWGFIADKQGTVRRVADPTPGADGRPIYPGVNVLQWRLFEIIVWFFDVNWPCVIDGLKPRKTGLSTACQGAIYWLHRTRRIESLTMADTYDTSDTLQAIMRVFVENDRFPWIEHGCAAVGEKPNEKKQWEFSNGGLGHRETARDATAGRGKTPQAQHRSEVAHFFKSGTLDAAKVLAGTDESTARLPGTLVINESTPNGASGYFYDHYQKALPFDEIQRLHAAGQPMPAGWNGAVRLFAAWFEFEEYTDRDATDAELDEIERTLTDHEAHLVDVQGVSLAQISWRRKKIASMVAVGGERMFLQEYPEDDVSCFLVSGRPFFEQRAIDRVIKLANARVPQRGNLTLQRNGKVTFFPCATGRVIIHEMPEKGRAYLGSADPMTGAEQVKDTGIADRHFCGILRAGYFRERHGGQRIWYNTAAVARIVPPFQDETRSAVELYWLLLCLYGNPLAVVEYNNQGSAWCFMLADKGQAVYQRERFDEATRRTVRQTGWVTNDETRNLMLTKLAEGLTPDDDGVATLDIWDPHFAGEMQTFAYASDGIPRASAGRHDDDVMGIGIGYFNIDQATVYRGQIERRAL